MSKTFASTYQYDPLDRLSNANTVQRFYNTTRIATEIEGERKSRFFEADTQPLAVQQHGTEPGTALFATDQQTSVLNGISPLGNQNAQAYSPFGYHPIDALLNAVGFNGERPEPITGHYLLGQGYRAFNPVLMRFNSPDSWSPFGEGGINAYAYCDNNPLNKIDPTGHFNLRKSFMNAFMGRVPRRSRPQPPVVPEANNRPRWNMAKTLAIMDFNSKALVKSTDDFVFSKPSSSMSQTPPPYSRGPKPAFVPPRGSMRFWDYPPLYSQVTPTYKVALEAEPPRILYPKWTPLPIAPPAYGSDTIRVNDFFTNPPPQMTNRPQDMQRTLAGIRNQ